MIRTLSIPLIGELDSFVLISAPLGVDDERALGELLELGSALGEWLGAVLGEVLEPLIGLLVGDLVLRTPVVRLYRTLFVSSHVAEMVWSLTGPIDGLGIDGLRVRSLFLSYLVVADVGSTQ